MTNYIPKASVIVPVYNAEGTIEECVNSILDLDYLKEKLELIFIDNASTDSTENILKKYAKEIIILFEKKRGPAAARNKGLRNSSGDVIAFTDSDCVVEKDWLKNLIQPLKNKQVGIVGGKILAKQPCNNIQKYGECIHNHFDSINSYKPPYVITMNWASRLSVLKEMNLFNEDFIRCEDVDLSYRIYLAGYKLVYSKDAVVYHKNEDSLAGLISEGYLHGVYSVQAIKLYYSLLAELGHQRININSYKMIIKDFKDSVFGQDKMNALCSAIFNSGKKIGKLLGSLKYAHLDI